MNRSMWKTTLREIKGSLGRYLAILAIVGLGVGFFSGLKVTRSAMVVTTDDYLADLNLYDYRMISPLGIREADVETFAALDAVEAAEGTYYVDVIVSDEETEFVVRMHSITETLNRLSIAKGRAPEAANECVADARYYDETAIGKTYTVSSSNEEAGIAGLKERTFTIVGLAYSPIYLNYERGTTSVGNGSIRFFTYVPKEAFAQPVYNDLYVALKEKASIYTKEYDRLVEKHTEEMEETLAECIAKVAPIPGIEGYTLTRNANVGYACFENDSQIVEGIAIVFPVFFFLVAALVCVTTMNRMVEEQRTQIGVLKALGYGSGTIMAKYMIYSGSAAVVGCVGGFFLGSFAIPKIIWIVYGLMYGFTKLQFLFDWVLFGISLLVSLLCSVGTTYVSVQYELRSKPATLIRPKSPKNGKRILLERITFLWKRIPFLHKVSIRNVVRYKKRLIMMVLGIGGCTGLIITGYGIRDSIATIADSQYEEILIYDEQVNFTENLTEEKLTAIREEYSDSIERMEPIYQSSYEIVTDDQTKSVIVIAPKEREALSQVVNLHTAKKAPIPAPEKDEIVLTANLAEKLHLKVGDKVTIRDSELKSTTLTLSGICENFFSAYAYCDASFYEAYRGEEPEYRTAYLNVLDGVDEHVLSAKFLNRSDVSSVAVNADTRELFRKMMSTLNYIIVLVLVCAAALAFIVLYNLTNINITERLREIATIKVLGFYPWETASYVFRENFVLTALGAIAGIPLGIALHRYVMFNIDIEMVSFDVHITGISFLYAILFTFGFACFVDFVMFFKLKRINMAESLKSIE